jgi:serine/threonine-protein kinase MRCK
MPLHSSPLTSTLYLRSKSHEILVRSALGIDPTRGIGTVYKGYVKVPKPSGVKKGWLRQFVVICDFKLFLYNISAERNAQPSVSVSQVLDMRDEQFEVSSVRDLDVIHANKKDIPCIFRVRSYPHFHCCFFQFLNIFFFFNFCLQVGTSKMDTPGLRNHLLMLADTESKKTKWVVALNELHRILKRNKLPNRVIVPFSSPRRSWTIPSL